MRVGILWRVETTELDALLAVLSKYGVTEAEFSETGAVKRVEMIPLALGGTAKNEDGFDGGGVSETPVDQAALRMLGRGDRSAA